VPWKKKIGWSAFWCVQMSVCNYRLKWQISAQIFESLNRHSLFF
jgi:hypothetical protein